ncbi:ABC transporter ATP-binding protein [Bosea sp. (in: a-proteobacteria)]|uniref:ABC transporter ATP-binding protein n=1 Tax=Bosea sp. (in: a-proteobacteria) TaxID=1871050 RepID=UPI001ACDA611|nr:ABC transporter ATP-binding protein [Bosea sp. (in: a-proteobacteria)]MBN9440691.1 ABC transporter ATP-binding protein [Bosea sp. (in: a-proteobacteria)]
MLTVRNLQVRYGAIEAVRGVDIEVREGELVALIGSNGAGKSTVLKAIAGLLRPSGGSIVFDGNELAGQPAKRMVERGVMLVPEGRRLFGDQSVADNLLLGGYRRRPSGGIAALRAMAEEYLDRFPILRERKDLPAGGLSGGQQQMLAISRGLMARPRLLLLDEPSLGLAPLIVRQIFDIIAELRRTGSTILLVEQMANLALRAADRAYVLERGEVVLQGEAKELLVHPRVTSGYLGRRTADRQHASSADQHAPTTTNNRGQP